MWSEGGKRRWRVEILVDVRLTSSGVVHSKVYLHLNGVQSRRAEVH